MEAVRQNAAEHDGSCLRGKVSLKNSEWEEHNYRNTITAFIHLSPSLHFSPHLQLSQCFFISHHLLVSVYLSFSLSLSISIYHLSISLRLCPSLRKLIQIQLSHAANFFSFFFVEGPWLRAQISEPPLPPQANKGHMVTLVLSKKESSVCKE